MGLFSNMTDKAIQEWSQNLTLEQIEEHERQGVDMSEYRIIYEQRQAEKKRLSEAFDLSMLDKYKTARSADFIDHVAKFNGLSDKKKQKLEQAPLVFGKVVQAAYNLYKPTTKKDSGGIVFVFAYDDAHRYNIEWLTKTVDLILEMNEIPDQNEPQGFLYTVLRILEMDKSGFFGKMIENKKLNAVPEDFRFLIKCLHKSTSSFGLKLDKILNDGSDSWCVTFDLYDQTKLPMAHIPENGIIPFLLSEEPQSYGGINDAAQLIPQEYYVKL